MNIANLKNITIYPKEDKNSNKYYLIMDKNTDEAYFCFATAVKEGWTELENNYEKIKEVELEYEVNERGNRKVKSMYSPDTIEFIA